MDEPAGQGPAISVAKLREAFWNAYGPSDDFLEVFGEPAAEEIFGPNWKELKDVLDRNRNRFGGCSDLDL